MSSFTFLGCVRAWLASTAAVMCALAPTVQAQNYPERPIRMILAFPAGGTADVITRYFAQKMSVILGKPVVVDTVSLTEARAKLALDGPRSDSCKRLRNYCRLML